MDLMICPKMSVRKQHALYVMTEHDLSTKFIDTSLGFNLEPMAHKVRAPDKLFICKI